MSEESTGGVTPTQQSESPAKGNVMAMSSNALLRICTSADAFKFFCQCIYDSKWFKCKSLGSAAMVLSTMLTERLSPVAFKAKYWMQDDGPTMKAEYMLAEFNRNHGTSTVIACTPDRACIELKKNRGKAMPFEFTWEQAVKEPFVWNKDGASGTVKKFLPNGEVNVLALKDNWATPHQRSAMLWARVVTAGLRKVAPEVLNGQTIAEECDDYIDVETVPAQKAAGESTSPLSAADAPAQPTTSEEPTTDTSAPAAATANTDSASPALADTPPQVLSTESNGVATGQETAALPTLGEIMAMSDAEKQPLLWSKMTGLLAELIEKNLITKERFKAALAKNYGVQSARELNNEQLGRLCIGMEDRLRKSVQAADLNEWAANATNTAANPT